MAKLTIESNNNHGALEEGPFARAQPGYVAGGGRFAKFATAADGDRAQERLLAGKTYAGGGLTPRQLLDRYTPAGKENPTAARTNYLAYIAEHAGVDLNKPTPQDKVPAIAKAMREFETGRGKKPLSREASFSAGIQAGLEEKEPYSVGAPTAGEAKRLGPNGETMFGVANPGSIDESGIAVSADKTVQATNDYASFLEAAVAPLRANAQQLTLETQSVAATKQNLANDVEARGTALLEQMKPLHDRRLALIARKEELDAMSPFERRLKSAFNSDYDHRIIEGRMARVNEKLGILEANYGDVNKIKSGIAGLLVDADAADVDVLNAKSNEILGDAKILGQVAGALRTATDTSMLPHAMQAETLRLQEFGKARLLGTMTTEMTTDAYLRARDSDNGTVLIDGVTLTVGELQTQARASQANDMNFRGMINSYNAKDVQAAEQFESQFIDHMSPEQLDVALKDGGMYQGKQLSLSKLAAAVGNANGLRNQNIAETVQSGIVGNAANDWKTLGGGLRSAGRRATEMFGTLPGNIGKYGSMLTQELAKYQTGLKEAEARGVRDQYIAAFNPKLKAMQEGLASEITSTAKQWGGGKPELTAVAEAYLTGNPLNGDSALRGLIIIAKAGMPAGSKLEGPALAAIQAATAVVRDWDAPVKADANQDMAAMMSPKKRTQDELIARVRDAVTATYTDNITNEVFNALPQLARSVRDESSPDKLHPFSRVSDQDFRAAVRHGDNQGFEVIGRELGMNRQAVQKMFAEGVDGAQWQAVAKAKGLQPAQFGDYQATLQSLQMTNMLQALDASPSSGNGFSAARAFVDFVGSKDVSNKVDNLVSTYGQSGFGAFLVSSAGSSTYRSDWQGYGQGLATTYQQLHSTELQERIQQQRTLMGSDPMKRMNVVLAASGLSRDEITVLSKHVREAAGITPLSQAELLGMRNPAQAAAMNQKPFDKLTYVILNGKFDDPIAERVRSKAAKRWNESIAVVQSISEAVK